MQQQPHQQYPMQQQSMGQQPGVTVITQNSPNDGRNKFQASSLSQMRVLSIIQIVMGILCVIFGITLIGLETTGYGTYGYAFVSYGIWCGLFFVLVGGIGLGAVNANDSCWIVSAMVLNILCAAIFFLPLLSLTSVGLTLASVSNYCDYSYYNYLYDCQGQSVTRAILALNSLMLLMSFAELVITIWSAALCCGAVCSCCYPAQRGQVIQYNAVPMVHGQQVVYPSVPATTTYGISMTGQQITTQAQYPAYPAGVHQPVGVFTMQQQAPPSYYTHNPGPSVENQGHEHLPPTAYPNNAQMKA